MRIPSRKLPGKSRCGFCKVFKYFSLTFVIDLLVFRDTNSQCVAVRLLAFPKQAAVGSFGAKTFAEAYKFRVSGCN